MKPIRPAQGKLKIIAIVGPTASGKSSLGAWLARKIGGEIISADSRQVYRGMRVISRAEQGHMTGVADPARQYSAGEYVKRAGRICSNILQNDKIPIVVGGTGLYVDTLLGRLSLSNVPPNKKLRKRLERWTTKQLFAQLKKLDPARAAVVDSRNRVRLVRAIEIAKGQSERTLRGSESAVEARRPYHILWLGLREPKNIKAGVEARLRRGMAAEARRLRKKLSKKRYGELGFEFDLLAQYLDGTMSRSDLATALARGERKYAIRQMRWFKRNKDIRWVGGKTEALRLAKQFLH